MQPAPVPPNEDERLAALRRLGLLHTPPEERFDRITRIALRLFHVPIALISLVDANQQWFKSCQGLSKQETDRNISFCAHAILQDELFLIPDTHLDTRFASNPLVTEQPHVRFYAGYRLKSAEGYPMGTLCILDKQPRTMGEADRQALKDLAAWAESELNSIHLESALILEQERRARVESEARRKRAEREVQTQYEFARQIMDSLGQGLTVTNSEARFEYVNPAYARMLGYAPSDLIGRSPREVTVPEDLPILEEARQRRLAGEESSYELRLQRADGSEVFVMVTGVPRFRDEEVVGSISVITDLTEHRQSEEALRESEERFRRLAAATFEGIAIHDQGIILDTNQMLRTMFGYEREELIGTNILMLTAPQYRDLQWNHIRAGYERPFEIMGVRKDGSTFPMEISGKGLPFKGRMARVVAMRDITESKEVQAELERRYWEAEYARTETRAILDAVSEAIVLMRPDHRAHMVNQRFCDLFAVYPEEVLTHSSEEIQPFLERVLEKPGAFSTLIASTIADDTAQFSDLLVQQYPERRHLALFSAPVKSAGNIHLGRLFVFRDVTHEREADQMKSEFVAMVSHELRTPLTSIKGFVDLLVSGEVGPLGEEQREFLGIVKSNADRLMTLIHDLLDLSRIETGKIAVELVPVNVPPLIHSTVALLRRQIEEKQQQLLIEVPSTLPPVLADPGRLIQILTNLLSNAHKYTPSGGKIVVTAEARLGQVAVSVQDTGVGLTPEEQGKLFTRFFRAHHRSTGDVGGTGLGLAITRSLVQLHGGEIIVRSVPNEGSTFTFTLPALPPEPVAEISNLG